MRHVSLQIAVQVKPVLKTGCKASFERTTTLLQVEVLRLTALLYCAQCVIKNQLTSKWF